jgi:hypothetical protein
MDKKFYNIVIPTLFTAAAAGMVPPGADDVSGRCPGALVESCVADKPHTPETQTTDYVGNNSTLSAVSSGPRTFTVDASVASPSTVTTSLNVV